MERIYKTHLLHLIETELSNYHREEGERAPLVEALELYPIDEDYNIYKVLYKIEDLDDYSDTYYIAKIRITHLIDVLSTRLLNQVLECLL